MTTVSSVYMGLLGRMTDGCGWQAGVERWTRRCNRCRELDETEKVGMKRHRRISTDKAKSVRNTDDIEGANPSTVCKIQ